ncbi:hypothetical protein VNO77_43348 [Canavalia gladiata]|uniref:BZIP domain-containing protein n=1 Tax=Canavalia gladiata TaxID=3824 RepID=A0AAN9JUN2_CANGL
MGDLTKRRIDDELLPLEEQPWKKGLGIAEASNNTKEQGATFGEPQRDCNTIHEMDPRRLKRILANRASSHRSRIRKMEYIEDLEEKTKSYQDKIVLLQPQIVAFKNHQRLLLIEQHKLKLQMAAREKERILQEVEIEKNKEEVNRLSELREKLLVEASARMVNVGATMQLMSNTSGF